MIECKGSNLGLYFCDQMDIAAELAVKLAKEYKEKRELGESDANGQEINKSCDNGSQTVDSSSS